MGLTKRKNTLCCFGNKAVFQVESKNKNFKYHLTRTLKQL